MKSGEGYGVPVLINGKSRSGFEKKGVVYVMEGFACEPDEIARFEKIIHSAGWDKDLAYRTLVKKFNRSTGLGDNVRQAGSLFDNQVVERMRDALVKTLNEMNLESNQCSEN